MRHLIIFLILGLVGCGGGLRQNPAGFINRTKHTDAYLDERWAAAQGQIAKGIYLNPIEHQLQGAPERILPGDSRAFGVYPREITVQPVPDITSDTWLAITGVYKPDPTGMIACPQPCNVSYACSYAHWGTARPDVGYAASWETVNPPNFPGIIEYELQSHILYALGYDVSWR